MNSESLHLIWADSFTLGPLYIQWKRWYSLDKRLAGPQILSGCCGEQKNPSPCEEYNPSYSD